MTVYNNKAKTVTAHTTVCVSTDCAVGHRPSPASRASQHDPRSTHHCSMIPPAEQARLRLRLLRSRLRERVALAHSHSRARVRARLLCVCNTISALVPQRQEAVRPVPAPTISSLRWHRPPICGPSTPPSALRPRRQERCGACSARAARHTPHPPIHSHSMPRPLHAAGAAPSTTALP